ncbi:hypothetical protein GJ496_007091 [Pomphorhynchus laevis]|nr:hypothetical protein GJ496_007091 [Pomphorhynchus laevis]
MGLPTDKNEEYPIVNVALADAVGGDFSASPSNVQFSDSTSRTQFVGLSKEELSVFENDPFWKKIRLGLFIGFWAIWCILLIAAILILVYTPPCPETVKMAWPTKHTGYALSLKEFTFPLLNDKNASVSNWIKALVDKLEYIKKMGFGYVIIHSDDIVKDGLNDEIMNSIEQLRKISSDKGLKLVLRIKNSMCRDSKDICDSLNTLIDQILTNMDFDGVYLIVGQLNDQFHANLISNLNAFVKSIGKRTLKEKCLLTEINELTEGINPDFKVSPNLYMLNSSQTVVEIAALINSSKDHNINVLDDVIGNRLTDRNISTNLPLHAAYLQPSSTIVNYGTEVLISNRNCNPPLMPWNSTKYSFSDKCNTQNNADQNNVYLLSAVGYPNSPYHLLQNLNQFRKNHSIFTFGKLHNVKAINTNILYWEIRYNLYNIYIVAINFEKDDNFANKDNVISITVSDSSSSQTNPKKYPTLDSF